MPPFRSTPSGRRSSRRSSRASTSASAASPPPRISRRRPARMFSCRTAAGISPACCSAWAAPTPIGTRSSSASLPPALPKGAYRLAGGDDDPALAALAFVLGTYRFDRYRKPKENGVAARPAGRRRRRRARADPRGRLPRPRPDQHARQRSVAARSGARRRRSRGPFRREPLGRRWGGAGARFPDGPCRRHRQRSAALPDRHPLGLRQRSEGDAGRQGHRLRHRRARHQAAERHGADEEGHGRRRQRARPRLA